MFTRRRLRGGVTWFLVVGSFELVHEQASFERLKPLFSDD